MTEGCIGVSVEGGCVGVSVEDPGIPDIVIGCCEQGPPGIPGMANSRVPFYLSDGTPASIQLVGGDVPFYLGDGSPAFVGII